MVRSRGSLPNEDQQGAYRNPQLCTLAAHVKMLSQFWLAKHYEGERKLQDL